MNYSNPFQTMQQMNQMLQNNSNPMQQMMSMARKQRQPINHQQFVQGASYLNEKALADIVTQARQQGISEEDIKNGLDFLAQLRK